MYVCMSRVRDEYYTLCVCVCVCVVELIVRLISQYYVILFSFFVLFLLLWALSVFPETKRQTLLLASVLIIFSRSLSHSLSLCFLHTTHFRQNKKIDIYDDGDVLLVQSPGDDEE